MAFRNIHKKSTPLFVLILWHTAAFAINHDSLFNAWDKALQTDDKNIPGVVYSITMQTIHAMPVDEYFQVRNQFGKIAAAIEDPEQKLRYSVLANSLTATLPNRLSYDSLYKELGGTLRLARLQDNDIMAACTCMSIGMLALRKPELEKSFFYTYQSIQLKEKTGPKYFPDMAMSYYWLATASFNSGQFRESIDYGIKATYIPDTSAENKANMCNVIGLGYHRLKMYDSALYWYRKGQAFCTAPAQNGTLSVISGNIGIVYYEQKKYDLALPLLKADFTAGIRLYDWGNACNSMQWAARIYAEKGIMDTALNYLHFTFHYATRIYNIRYKKNIYEAAVEIYRKAGMPDSAWFYNDSVKVYGDSLKVTSERARLGYIKAQIDYENSMTEIDNLKKERSAEVVKRNFAVLSVFLLGFSALLFWNRKKLEIKHRQQILQKEKEAAKQDAIAAMQQLQLVTQNLIDKNTLIENLQSQLQHQQISGGLQEKIDALLKEVILTDDDWMRYRSLFEKVHPGFLNRLREKVPDITVGEQRIAALTRLMLDNKQMAAILGISADSVAKSKRRLRQRLNLDDNSSLEAFIAGV